MEFNLEGYLGRLGLDGPPPVDRAGLEQLMRAHLAAVPFDNLDVFAGRPVSVEPEVSVAKIVDRRRGGWCFELNGAFAALLEHLGFPVLRLGAAVLLGGPTTVIDHLCLEVSLDEPYLVDVGFGDSFCVPLRLNQRGPQTGGTAPFELIDSREGLTLTRHDEEGVPVAQYRFRRVGVVDERLRPSLGPAVERSGEPLAPTPVRHPLPRRRTGPGHPDRQRAQARPGRPTLGLTGCRCRVGVDVHRVVPTLGGQRLITRLNPTRSRPRHCRRPARRGRRQRRSP